MKKHIWKKITPLLVAGTLVASSLPGLLSSASTATKTTQTVVTTRAEEAKLSRDVIRNIALAKVSGGRITELELDGRNHYEVEIEAGGIEYELTIHAVTGEILKFEQDDRKVQPARESTKTAGTKASDTKASQKERISRADAEAIALAKVGGGKVTDFEFDDNKYEIEIKFDGKEHDLDINVFTGAITDHDVENDESSKKASSKASSKASTKPSTKPSTKAASKSRISNDKARQIALDRVGGGKITDFEYDDGEFEIEIKFNGKEYDLDINAYSGKITDFDVENDHSQKKTSTKASTKPSTKAASKSRISTDKAKSIALNKVGGGKVTDFEYDDGKYEVEVKYNGYEYEMDINAYTGKISDYEVDKDDDYRKPTTSTKKTSTKSSRISSDKAKEIALNRVGGGKVTDFEYDDGEYEIEIKYNGKEYELEINAYSGKITDFEVDDDDDYKKSSTRISSDKAKQIALARVGGGKVTDFEYDDGEYEIEIKFNGSEYEIEMDAYTGTILEFERD